MARKKYKEPLMLRLTRWAFPKIERLSPALATRLFVQLFFTPLHYGFPEKEREWVASAKKSWLELGKKRVALYEWGEEGKPFLLFIHGWAGRATQFRKFFQPALVRGWRIISFDGPAHGKSAGKRTNVLEFHEVLSQVIARYGKPSGVIGHSFGGTVTLHGAMKGLAIERVAIIGTPVIAELLIRSFLRAVNGSETTGLSFRNYLKERYGRDFNEFSVEWFLPRLPKPVELLIVHDENDRDVAIAHAHEAKRLLPSAKLSITRGLGHTRILKDSTVISEVLDFMGGSKQLNAVS